MRFVELRAICKVVADYQRLIQLLHLQLLGCLGDLALPLDDVPQRRLVPLVVVGPLPFGIHPQVLLYVLLDGDPAIVDPNRRTEDVDFLEDSAVLLQNHADQQSVSTGDSGRTAATATILCVKCRAVLGKASRFPERRAYWDTCERCMATTRAL